MSWTLEDVLLKGEGVERPFRCHEHDDHNSSASVNVVKGVWCCYACGAAGTVDGKKIPSADDLAIMMQPDETCRVYPEAYLEMFALKRGNFATRFPDWLCWHAKLGCDPITGDATFPVRTPMTKLAGVGRRRLDPGEGPRYIYPPRWSAARSLFYTGKAQRVVVLVEGAADSSSVAETGAFAAGLFGSGLHKPQIDLVMRAAPRLVLLATDADEAGRLGAERAADALQGLTQCEFVDWSLAGAKDPAELSVEVRRELLVKTVVDASYGSGHDIEADWVTRAKSLQDDFERYVEENDG